eukprot:3110349-Pyramimonas_sp.AAC.1
MAAPILFMRSRAVVDASSSVRHALRPVVRRWRRICLFPNGATSNGLMSMLRTCSTGRRRGV